MDYAYEGYNEDRKLMKGVITAPCKEAATQVLSRNGCRVLRLEPAAVFMPQWHKLFPSLFRIRPEVIIMFSRQLALLLESGIDIVTALELLEAQTSSKGMKGVLSEMVSELRSGNPLSVALSKQSAIFSKLYVQSVRVAEQSGELEKALRQIAGYMETEITAVKDVKNALKYPALVAVVAAVVVMVILIFVLPALTSLYRSMGARMPPIVEGLLSVTRWLKLGGPYLAVAAAVSTGAGLAYIRTPGGRFRWDSFSMRMPLVGRVNHLNELARCCRTMSLLFQAGLALPEIMNLTTESTDNAAMRKALAEVRQDMLQGQGLSKPMTRNEVFLPMMVQMVGVGEKTGNLDVTLMAVGQSYETEARDRMRSIIGLIQPAVTIVIGIVVAFVALSLVSAMYSIYGQVF